MNHALKIMIRNVIIIQIIMLTLANAFSAHAMRDISLQVLALFMSLNVYGNSRHSSAVFNSICSMLDKWGNKPVT